MLIMGNKWRVPVKVTMYTMLNTWLSISQYFKNTGEFKKVLRLICCGSKGLIESVIILTESHSF